LFITVGRAGNSALSEITGDFWARTELALPLRQKQRIPAHGWRLRAVSSFGLGQHLRAGLGSWGVASGALQIPCVRACVCACVCALSSGVRMLFVGAGDGFPPGQTNSGL
jgi:hypothetical protein